MSERLITDQIIYGYCMSRWLQHDARRLATAMLWGVYTPEEALQELQFFARIRAKRAGMDFPADGFAWHLLIREYLRQAECHLDTRRAIERKVVSAVRNGCGKTAVVRCAADVARNANIAPPPHVVEAAIKLAKFTIRRANRG